MQNLIAAAIPRRMTRAQVARKVGISRVPLQRIMAGTQLPSVEVALKISAVLQRPVDELFQLEDEPAVRRKGGTR